MYVIKRFIDWSCDFAIIQEWLHEKTNVQGINSKNVKYVYEKTGFEAVNTDSVEYLMGKTKELKQLGDEVPKR